MGVVILMGMQQHWSSFEKRIYSDLTAQGMTCVKVPEKMLFIKGKVVRQKTDFDFCVGNQGQVIFFDAKCMSAEDRFNYKSRITNDKKIHQLNALLSAHERGNTAGFLFHFMNSRVIGWASAQAILDDINAGVKTLIPSSPILTTQPDHIPINLNSLIEGEPDAAPTI